MNNKNSLSKITINYLIALVPLIIYGCYKNGLFLYQKDMINFSGIFKPFIIILGGFLISLIVNFIFNKNKKIFEDISILDGLLIAVIMPLSINVIYFTLILFILLIISKLLDKIIKFNNVSFIKIIFFIICIYIFKVDYLNIYESTKDISINLFDRFIGKGSGGIASTSILLSVIGYFYLNFRTNYKKEIPLYICSSFLIIMSIYGITKDNYLFGIEQIYSNFIVFASIFIAPIFKSSPYTKLGKGFYGVIIGCLTAVLILVTKLQISIFIIIFIVSLISPLLDKIFYKKIKK